MALIFFVMLDKFRDVITKDFAHALHAAVIGVGIQDTLNRTFTN